MVVPDHDREFLGHYVDMEMLVLAGAQERSHKQWTDLLLRGGFRLQRVVQTAGPLCVIEAVPSEETIVCAGPAAPQNLHRHSALSCRNHRVSCRMHPHTPVDCEIN